jgi:hypothetical protein
VRLHLLPGSNEHMSLIAKACTRGGDTPGQSHLSSAACAHLQKNCCSCSQRCSQGKKKTSHAPPRHTTHTIRRHKPVLALRRIATDGRSSGLTSSDSRRCATNNNTTFRKGAGARQRHEEAGADTHRPRCSLATAAHRKHANRPS